jgi:hypothetical protein
MNKLSWRVYSDYLMPSRLGIYEDFLRACRQAGYQHTSLRAMHTGAVGAGQRVVVHRHDIDSDLRTARKMFALERRFGVSASYYFRRSTMMPEFMRIIEQAGSEASYHYEEVADFAKRHHIRCGHALRARMDEIGDQFYINFEHIKRCTGVKMATVSSHGDFVNRKLQVINHELLKNPALRRRCGITWEAYDADLINQFDIYISDRPAPVYFSPMSPFDALGRYDKIYLVTHPSQWETNWLETSKTNLVRLVHGVRW